MSIGHDPARLGDNSGIESRYIVSNFQGEVLTDISNPKKLEWTDMALLEDLGRKAVVFRDPYRIPARVEKQLTENHQLFKVDISGSSPYADAEAVLMAEFVMNVPKLFAPTSPQDLGKRTMWDY